MIPIAAISLFISFSWNNALDIILVAVLIYQLYNLSKGTVAIKIFIGIVAIYLVWKLVVALQMEMLGEILGQFIQAGVIVLIIVFQQELRRFLLMIGNSELFKGKAGNRIFRRWMKIQGKEKEATDIKAIVMACQNMGSSKTGALIVIGRQSDPLFYCSSSENLDAQLSTRLLESIFFKNSPMHDGAVVIAGNRIQVVRAVLPVTESPEFPSDLGMRHRSAVGITEQSDAISVVVSEQTGQLSLGIDGKLKRNLSPAQLTDLLQKNLT